MTEQPAQGSIDPAADLPVYPDAHRPDPQPESELGSRPSDASVTQDQTGAHSDRESAEVTSKEEPGPAATTAPPPAADEDLLAHTRVSGTWIALIVFALLLVLLLIFVLQNTQKVEITFFTANFTMPLAVAMLLSAVTGVLLAAIAGTLRILQLRKRVKKSQQT